MWDVTISQWLLKSKFTYNTEEGRTEHLLYIWNDESNKLITQKKEVSVYDIHRNRIKYEEYTWNIDLNEWGVNYMEKLTYYYSSSEQNVLESTKHTKLKSIKIYPNPTTDFIVFELKEETIPALIEICSLNGQKILSKQILSNGQVSISHLAEGLYIVNIIQGEKTFSTKVLIK